MSKVEFEKDLIDKKYITFDEYCEKHCKRTICVFDKKYSICPIYVVGFAAIIRLIAILIRG